MIDASTCRECGYTSVPAAARCAACGGSTGATTVPPEGIVLAWTRLASGPVVALVELDRGARVLARCDQGVSVGTAGNVEIGDVPTFTPRGA